MKNPHATDAMVIRASLADGMGLRFSSNLMSFPANRKDRGDFRLGDWLQSLDDDTLGHLQQLAEMALYGSSSVGAALEHPWNGWPNGPGMGGRMLVEFQDMAKPKPGHTFCQLKGASARFTGRPGPGALRRTVRQPFRR